ncbi:YidH family protein [Klenkia sp. PcliD-1-E]|uniref:YidH family protein n=1 Tax=Klenkia sp. PcliD-1-E TaxID=2954492 RepID=UPI0020970AF2|nr:DUF202 domain-containing protein [Klenkia sp. PcliD-1-E]MCO7221124.1 DUF202 domain-containing protein [Klenkia sp. PcliD-1-E]
MRPGGGGRAAGRFPSRVYRAGQEPDPRFSLANERTFLAWIRTALALLAAGMAVEALDLPIPDEIRSAAAVVLVVLGLVAPAQAWFGWAGTERALRHGQALPSARSGPWLAAGVLVAGALLLVGLLVR